MKLYIEKDKLADSPVNFLRRAGYGFLQARGDKQDSFARRLYGNAFPRLHMYVNDRGGQWEFHLHLDQKPVSYEGSNAHSGEYEGEVVEAEISRLRDKLGISNDNAVPTNNRAQNNQPKDLILKKASAEEKLGEGILEDIKIEKKRSFWRKLFQ